MLTIRLFVCCLAMMQGALLLPAQDCANLSWEAALTRSVNSASGMYGTSRVVSGSLVPITLGLPVAFTIAGASSGNRETMLDGIEMGTTMVGTYATVIGLKALFGRDRPYIAHQECINGQSTETDGSMPSGHAAGTAALAMSLSLQHPQWYVIVPSVTYAVATGLARMNLGVHYVSDLLVGYAIGAGIAYVMHVLRPTIERVFEPFLPAPTVPGIYRTTSLVNVTFGL
jgi:membrane-associated phospholipid phosphatase